jgi:[ribosomal protein S5]-alanine N-acetyltransferase
MSIYIDTPRFFLRPLTSDDATDRYVSWLRDQSVQRFIAAAKTSADLVSLRQYIAAKSGRPDALFLGIFLHRDGQHIGNVKYEPVNIKEGYAVMGILIGDPSWRGQGVAVETLEASSQWLNKHRGIDEIVLGVERENRAGIRSYQKAGFKIQNTDHIQHDPQSGITMVLRMSRDA